MFFKPSQTNAINLPYPISELGGCRDAKECYFYCEIPKNSPACWSYNKYIINGQILGDATVNIIYPVAELGNCATAEACFSYCTNPINQTACMAFGKNNGLVKDTADEEINNTILKSSKTELGCDSRESCMALCNQPENFEKCSKFAETHKLGPLSKYKKPGASVLLDAKNEFGCINEVSCKNFCSFEENASKCFEFAKKHNLLDEEELAKQEEFTLKKQEMVNEAKTILGCDSEESCRAYCGQKENAIKCRELASKFGLGPPPIPGSNININGQPANSSPSTDNANNQAQTDFTKPPPVNIPPEINKGSTPASIMITEGPGGCKTEKECKAYCDKNPGKCPGFPKPIVTVKPSPKISPTPFKTASTNTAKVSPTPKTPRLQPASTETNTEPLPLLTLPPLEPN